ncbi:Protein IQ-DOMAIN 14 [Acorus gramineus]|uniref:Protein IQ-DOMAIN 14 n=1 Tax=Acorus gramineus TaxID=55184 RepID=A0AAV9AP99_ACOGR|nr:Protein IQ-DOMAIN 14 [Acorus gramineus]
MGKKGSWISALKRAFSPSSKEKVINSPEKKNVKHKRRWGLGRPNHGESRTRIPLKREPSSIEKILGDAERLQIPFQQSREAVQRPQLHKTTELPLPNERQVQRPQLPVLQHVSNANKSSLPVPPQKEVQRQHVPPQPRIRNRKTLENKPLAVRNQFEIATTKIQAAYRGYMARRNYRALKGLVRLQRLVKGQGVMNQTANAMRCMQMLVRIKSQVQSWRLQKAEEAQSRQQHRTPRMSEFESGFGKWSFTQSEAGQHEEWDDSVLTKVEMEARMRRKVEAIIKRERALAYAYSHQLSKAVPKSALMDIGASSSAASVVPWLWNWFERHLPTAAATTRAPPTPTTAAHATPRSSRPPPPAKHVRDDESLTSCPPFTAAAAATPRYMAHTASAKAKSRPQTAASSRGVRPSTAAVETPKRRFSFAMTPGGGGGASMRWGGREVGIGVVGIGRHRSMRSVGELSVDSAVSLPAVVGGSRRHYFK